MRRRSESSDVEIVSEGGVTVARFFESPSRKSQRYGRELKRRKDHRGTKLSKARATYRMGYLNARRDLSNARKYYK